MFCNPFVRSFQVFLDTFNLACQEDGQSQIVIPEGTFLVESVEFKGPCKGPIEFQVSGTIKARPGLVGNNKWISFWKIDRLTISGSGTFDGQGETAWPYNDCGKNPKCQPLPIVSQQEKQFRSKKKKEKYFNFQNKYK